MKLTDLFIEHEQIAGQADVGLCDSLPHEVSSGQQVFVEEGQCLGHLLLGTLSLLGYTTAGALFVKSSC